VIEVEIDASACHLLVKTWDQARQLASKGTGDSEPLEHLWMQAYSHPGNRRVPEHIRCSVKDLSQGLAECQLGIVGKDPSVSRQVAGAVARALGHQGPRRSIEGLLDRVDGDLVQDALRRARRYLPDGTQINARVILTLGGSDSWAPHGPQGEIVLNLLPFTKLGDALLTKALAHELHHIAFFSLHGSKAISEPGGFLQFVVTEGLAMRTMMPLTVRDSYYFVLWQRHLGKTKSYIRELPAVIAQAEGGLSDEITAKWIRNFGAGYYLGHYLVAKIEQNRGGEAVRSAVAAGPTEVLGAYNNLAKSRGLLEIPLE